MTGVQTCALPIYIPLLHTEYTMEELAQAVGKSAPVAAIAVTDAGFAAAIKDLETKNQ